MNDPDPGVSLEPIDLSGIRTAPLASRPSLVSLDDFAGLPEPGASAEELLDSFPGILAGRTFHALADAIVDARRDGRQVVAAIGGHVVKCGCGPILIDLAERGIVTAFVMNGAAAIHDWEIAVAGKTSEDVAARMAGGAYGMADETGRAFAAAAERGAREGIGLGRALAEDLAAATPPHAPVSIVEACARLEIPLTVHVALGTDTVHMHPACEGAPLGEALAIDFRKACTLATWMERGVWINVGSAVLLPEVLLKAVTVARNLGHEIPGLTTANLDMLRHYRTRVNVLERPGDRGLEITGHHEITLPLLRMAVVERWAGGHG